MKNLRRGVGILGCVALCLGVLGCSPGVEETLAPWPTQGVTQPTPTSRWSGDELAAVDAVQLSIETWSRIGQNMNPAEFGDIWDVATPGSIEVAQALWDKWMMNGWHLVGDPYFIPTGVSLGAADDEGQRFLVVGCYIIEGTDIVDDEGVSQTGDDRIERGVMRYTILKTPDGRFLQAGSEYEDGIC